MVKTSVRKDLVIRLRQMKKPGLWFLHLDLEQPRRRCRWAPSSRRQGGRRGGPSACTRWGQGTSSGGSVHSLDSPSFLSSHVSFFPSLFYTLTDPLSFLYLSMFTLCSNLLTPVIFHPLSRSLLWRDPFSMAYNTGVCVCVCERERERERVAQSCPSLCNPMNCSLPGSSVHGIHQARIQE